MLGRQVCIEKPDGVGQTPCSYEHYLVVVVVVVVVVVGNPKALSLHNRSSPYFAYTGDNIVHNRTMTDFQLKS